MMTVFDVLKQNEKITSEKTIFGLFLSMNFGKQSFSVLQTSSLIYMHEHTMVSL